MGLRFFVDNSLSRLEDVLMADRVENPAPSAGAERSDAPKQSESSAFRDNERQTYPPPEDISKLADKERFSDLGQGPKLSNEETAKLYGWRTFPNPADGEFRDLAERRLKADRGIGEPLSKEDNAKLNGKLAFPDEKDASYRKLHEKDLLSQPPDAKGPELTGEERAKLFSKLAFPDSKDDSYRILHERDLKAQYGKGEPLSPQEASRLSSKLAFPHDEQARKLWEKDLNFQKKVGPELTSDEKALLMDKFAGRRGDGSSDRKVKVNQEPKEIKF